MNDTPSEVAEMVRKQLMAKSGAERFLIGISMFEAARDMVLASLPHNLSDEERKQRLFERLYNAPFPPEHAMKITKDVHKYAAEQEAIERGMNEKSKAFVEKGAEVYAKA
jgi:hypothetical protein